MLIEIPWHSRVVPNDWTQILTNPLLNINVHSAKPGLSSSMTLDPGEHMGQPALLRVPNKLQARDHMLVKRGYTGNFTITI